MNALAETLDLNNAGIQAWITLNVSTYTHLSKIMIVSANNVDQSRIGQVINDVKGVSKWQIKAITWHESCLSNKKEMMWM